MQLKHLGKLFAGVARFTSDDPTRSMLAHAFIPNDTTVEATDGHKLIRVTVPKGHGLASGYYDAAKAAALCKVDMLPVPIAPEASWVWPYLDAVIPPTVTDAAPAHSMLVDMRYLTDTVEGMRTALSGFGHESGVLIQFPVDSHGPIRFDAAAYDGVAVAVAVLMPRYK